MRLLSLATLCAICTFSAISTADRPVVGVSSLPSGEVSKPPPASKITHASGKADGFVLTRESGGYTMVRSEKVSDEQRFTSRSSAGCFSTASSMLHRARMRKLYPHMRDMPATDEELDWDPQSMSTTTFGSRGDLQTTVLHREELVVQGEQAILETRDAVATASGVRVIDKRSLPMRKVGEFASGVHVFALRAPNTVEFVVHVPSNAQGQPDTFIAQSSVGNRVLVSSQCQHVRVSVPITKGDGSEWSVSLRVVDKNADGSTPTPDQEGIVTRVLRTMHVHLSTSWLSNDREATISVTAGWHGPSERQRDRVALETGLR